MQLQPLHRTPPQPQILQGGLFRSHSAPALSGAVMPMCAKPEALQPSAQRHRDFGQHGTPSLAATQMQRCSGQSGKLGRKLQRSSKPTTPSITERQAWCNTFNPPRPRPAGQKPRRSSKHALSFAKHDRFQLYPR